MILVEHTPMTEAPTISGSKETLRLRFRFLEANRKSPAGRYYPQPVLAQAIREAQAKLAQGGMLFGTTGKLNGPELEVDEVSHRLTKLEMVGDSAYTEAQIFPTAKGRNLAALIANGAGLGAVARGFGNVGMVEGRETVQPGYTLKAVDITIGADMGDAVNAGCIFECASFAQEDEATIKALYEGAQQAGFRGSYPEYRRSYLRRR